MRHERPNGARVLYAAALFSIAAYVLSAIIFVAFSYFFMKSHGSADYGRFSLLLNTVSALTLLGNYHGSLVSYSVTTSIRHYLDFRISVLVYSIGAALLAAMILTVVGQVAIAYFPLLFVSFFFLTYSGFPSAVLLASPGHYILNFVRVIYQTVLIFAFWPLVTAGADIPSSFAIALLLAASLNLFVLAITARRHFSWRESSDPARPHLLVAALMANAAMMATILLDKFALRFLLPGTAEQRGVYLLYSDLIGRLSAAFNILLPSLTYVLLGRIQARSPLTLPISAALFCAACIGAVAYLGGYFLIPSLYSLSAEDIGHLPITMALLIAFYGCSSILLAFCNASGRAWYLGAHYFAMFAVTLCALLVSAWMSGVGLTINGLAWSVSIGQGTALGSAALLYFMNVIHRPTREMSE